MGLNCLLALALALALALVVKSLSNYSGVGYVLNCCGRMQNHNADLSQQSNAAKFVSYSKYQ
ncbi:hypothetical protein TYM08_P1126 [Marinicellulosiphila megalodicopiae]